MKLKDLGALWELDRVRAKWMIQPFCKHRNSLP